MGTDDPSGKRVSVSTGKMETDGSDTETDSVSVSFPRESIVVNSANRESGNGNVFPFPLIESLSVVNSGQ